MDYSAAKFAIEGKVNPPAYRYKEINSSQVSHHKRRLSQGSDGHEFNAKRYKVSEPKPEVIVVEKIEESLVADVPVTSSSLFHILGRGSTSTEIKSSSSDAELFDFTYDDVIEDDVFLPEGLESETERYEESLQLILDTLRYGAEDSIQTLLGYLRTSL